MRVLITGGLGTLGRLLVPRLLIAGHQVVVTSRRGRTPPEGTELRELDLRRPVPEGLLAGVDAVVHAASDPLRSKKVDVMGTSRLISAARSAEVGHFAYLSIVGIDDHPFPYYRAKRAAESTIEQSAVPWTVLRATQFHEFLDRIFSTGPIITVFRGIDFQVVDGGAVADRLTELMAAGPHGRVDDIGGPRSESMDRMARTWKQATGSRRPRLSIPVAGQSARAFKNRMHHSPSRAEGTPTWDEWLAARYH